MERVLECLVAAAVRVAIGIGHYSGFGKPPMYGDFEAQRHWLEITHNLPPLEWYHNTSRNDLLYWGLDYPPLTAHHSRLLGAIADIIEPKWVSLKTSRGIEGTSLKVFMRASVLIADLVVFVSAVLAISAQLWKQKFYKQMRGSCLLLALLLYPGLLLVDHAHFQYNCISLGLLLWAVYSLHIGRYLLATFVFCLALNYKQLELYHSLPFFCYLLGRCWKAPRKLDGVMLLVKLALMVFFAFALCWFPFLGSVDTLKQIMRRLFPFSRGLFEDKVANFWCTTSLLIKWNRILPIESLVKLSTLVTFVSVLPSCIMLVMRPSKQQFRLALITVSLGFFLFSFHVHEKTILLAAVPLFLVCHELLLQCLWFLLISAVSLHSLCVKDETTFQFWVLTVWFYVFVYLSILKGQQHKSLLFNSIREDVVLHVSVICAFGICTLEHIMIAPRRYPHLFSVLFVTRVEDVSKYNWELGSEIEILLAPLQTYVFLGIMLRPKALTEVLGQAVTGGVIAAMLVNKEGILLAYSGFGQSDACKSSAIASSIWSTYEKMGQDLLEDEKLKYIFKEDEFGHIGITKVSNLLVCLLTRPEVQMGMLKLKLSAVAEYLRAPLDQISVA